MRYVHGKEVLESLEEIALPGHSALIVVDVQNDRCLPEGLRGREGADLSMMAEMITNLKALLHQARQEGLLRVFIEGTQLADSRGDSGAWIHRNLAKGGAKMDPPYPGYCVEGTWGHEIVADLQPLQGETRVRKHRSSAFHQTDLDLILRSNGIKTAIVTGVVTEGCVDSTVRDALFHDYYAVVPTDCVASHRREYHEASLLISRADLCISGDLLRVWANLREPARRV